MKKNEKTISKEELVYKFQHDKKSFDLMFRNLMAKRETVSGISVIESVYQMQPYSLRTTILKIEDKYFKVSWFPDALYDLPGSCTNMIEVKPKKIIKTVWKEVGEAE